MTDALKLVRLQAGPRTVSAPKCPNMICRIIPLCGPVIFASDVHRARRPSGPVRMRAPGDGAAAKRPNAVFILPAGVPSGKMRDVLYALILVLFGNRLRVAAGHAESAPSFQTRQELRSIMRG